MRQVIILEKVDMEALKVGETLIINLGNGSSLDLKFEGAARRQSSGSVKGKVLGVLEQAKTPLRIKDICMASGISSQNVSNTLKRMLGHGVTRKSVKIDGKMKPVYSYTGETNGTN